MAVLYLNKLYDDGNVDKKKQLNKSIALRTDRQSELYSSFDNKNTELLSLLFQLQSYSVCDHFGLYSRLYRKILIDFMVFCIRACST